MMPRQRAAENKNTPGYDAQFKNDGGAAFASNLVSLKLVELFCQLMVDGVCAGQQSLFWVLSASLGDRIDHVAAAVVRYAGEDRRESFRGTALINQPEFGFDVVGDGLHLALVQWRWAHDHTDGHARGVITDRLSDSHP